MTHETDWQLIRNRYHTYGNPISVTKMDQVLALLRLPAGARALDVGCGKGELLIRIAEIYGATTVGIDPSPVLQMARRSAGERVPDGDTTWYESNVDDVELEPGSFDVTSCIGATHAFGGSESTLRALHRLTKPGGFVLVGDGFWAAEPPAEYFAGLGIEPFEQESHAGNMETAAAQGLRLLYSTVSSRDEWDEFEGLYRFAMEQHLHDHGLPEEQMLLLAASNRFYDAQMRWGRDVMGFALYLYRRPAA